MRITNGIIAIAFALTACGGGGPTRPKPIKTKIDEMMLARVPSSEQNAVVEAHSAYQRSRLDYHNAEGAFKESKTKIKVAENDYKQAKLEVESAKATSSDAKASADQNRVNVANKERTQADRKAKAAKAKVAAWKEKRKALKLMMWYREEDMFYKESKWELEKAKVARAKNIKPAGFDAAKFTQQEAKRKNQVAKAKARADKAQAKANKKWQAYKEMHGSTKTKSE